MSSPRFTSARIVLVLLLVVGGATGATTGDVTFAGQQDPAVKEMSGDSGPKVVPPDQRALDAALQIPGLTDRLLALDKFRREYPQSALLGVVDVNLLLGALQMPDAEDSAAEIIDRMLARVPATATADERFAESAAIASRLIGRKVLLDRAEALLQAAMAPPALSRASRAAGQYQLGRLHAARGDVPGAEAAYRTAAADSPAAVSALVALYIDRGDREKAETFLQDVVKTTPVNMAALTSLVSLYKSDPPRAEAILRDAVGRDPMQPGALLQLARLERERGHDAGALDHFLKAAALTYLRGPDADALTALYTKQHGNTDALDADINERYRALPPALHADRYVPTPARSDRFVLLEMFTGSACPPCVAADLAFDAALERYGADVVVPLAYHVHIPGPDPMTTPEGDARRRYYAVNGVPTFEVDGAMVTAPGTSDNLGGGGRDRAADVYAEYVRRIDRALESPAAAAVSVRATAAAGKVIVTADVTTLPADVSGLTLHIVLAEKGLMFGGENGIRGHRMVVRGLAGEAGKGLPLAKTGPAQYTFDLAQIREAITRSLASDIARRRGASAGTPQTFAAEDRAMTSIDPTQLVAVAFIQSGNRTILQAARADVVAAAGGK